MKKIIHNVETGIIEEVEMTPEEIVNDKKLFDEIAEKRIAAKNQWKIENANRIELLIKTGMTEDEAIAFLS